MVGWFLIAVGVGQLVVLAVVSRRPKAPQPRRWSGFNLLQMGAGGLCFVTLGVAAMTGSAVRASALVLAAVWLVAMIVAAVGGMRAARRPSAGT